MQRMAHFYDLLCIVGKLNIGFKYLLTYTFNSTGLGVAIKKLRTKTVFTCGLFIHILVSHITLYIQSQIADFIKYIAIIYVIQTGCKNIEQLNAHYLYV